MELLKYFLLGIIEGITEFLPISSTAHLILVSNLLKIPQTEFHKFLEIFIQTGAILAVIFNYFKFILDNKHLIPKLLASFIPTAIISLIFYKLIKNVFFESQLLIILTLILGGLIFIIFELLINKKIIQLQYSLDNLTFIYALLIGIFQSLAIIPGVSRAGAVILGMLFLRFQRKDSVLYSFLLAVPTIISAGFYDLYKVGIENLVFNFNNIFYLSIAFLTSFVFALLTINWLINYLNKNNFLIFGYYRLVFGLLFLFFLII
ncbi:MAG: undecaprenyl-diphosphatase [Candidatus Parcubacteria bacterium]|nr:MAG: undecaprenyl-diphosphatase [Candidatus Parcubacteria bacterium]